MQARIHLLQIFVILFLAGCASPYSAIDSGRIYAGMSKDELRDSLLLSSPGEDPFLVGSYETYISNSQREIIAGANRNIYYVFENVTQPLICGTFSCAYGNGQLKSWVFDVNSALQLANQSNSATINSEPTASPSNSQLVNLFATAANGEIDLTLSIENDPYVIELTPGGALDASTAIEGCTGFIDGTRPDLQINYTETGSQLLGFYGVSSDVDSTIIVNSPTGEWYCNDDLESLGQLNSGVEISNPTSGIYDIWVGTFSNRRVTETVYLAISEIGNFGQSIFGKSSLEANFSPDPFEVEITTFGVNAASDLDENCSGYINQIWPSYEVEYLSGNFPLSFLFDAEFDSTLVIETPNGDYVCNDDFSSSLGFTPGVSIPSPQSGTYRIWVGNYSLDDRGKSGTLLITEIDLADIEDEISSSSLTSSSGTGFVISHDGHVLTNAHVVSNCNSIQFEIGGQRISTLSLLALNATADLAVLMSDQQFQYLLEFSSAQQINLGQDLVVFGFPLAGALSSGGNLTTGIISGLSGLEDNLNQFQMTAPIQPGNSGGPVFNRNGQLIGVVVAKANDDYFRNSSGSVPQNVNFAIRLSVVESFLQTNNVPHSYSQVGSTLSPEEIAIKARSATGRVVCN